MRQAADHFVGLAASGGTRDALAVVARLDPADRDIVAGRQVVAHEILEDDAHAAAQIIEPVVAQVVAVEQDAALVGVVEAGQQLHQRGLARTVLADQRHHLAGLQGEGEMAYRPALGAGIDEAHILEHEAFADRPGERQGIGRRMDFRPDLEEGEEIVEVERLAGHGREAAQQRFEQRAKPAERAREEGEVAHGEFAGQRAPGDVGVGEVVADRADGGEQPAPAGAAQRQAPVGVVERGGKAAVAIDQELVEAEDLHFLGGLGAGRGLADIVELAPLGRAAEVERVALGVEMGFAQERRDQRHDQQHDQPGREDDQAGREAGHGDEVLRLREELAHQGHAAAGLAAGAFELVLELGILEILEVEGCGMFHQPHARTGADALGQHPVEQRDHAAQHVGQHRHGELGRQQ